jgi:UDP:flavonoid glycosyltransferase YjiC (YdhE family)
VVVPADYDQFDNAARVEEAGVGLCVWKDADLSPFIARALGDAAMRTRCRRLQARLAADRAEDRVAASVHAVLGRRSHPPSTPALERG